uniref:Uncharacterized protein n=1 Tax=Rhizophora mucronata TaxID=61149 RepID=A0A2P2QD94_RHIMU
MSNREEPERLLSTKRVYDSLTKRSPKYSQQWHSCLPRRYLMVPSILNQSLL